jgi:site-specific DNA recombinase
MIINQSLKITNNIAAFYGRVSTEEQLDGYSIEGQLKEVRTFCEDNNLQLLFEYSDPGVSGKSITNRPGLQQAIADAESGKFSHLLIWKLTRLSRKTIDTLEIVDRLNKVNVSLRSVSEPQYDTTTSSGMFFITMMAAIAQMERENIGENVRMGMRQCASQGIWVGGEPYGYNFVNSGKTHEERKHNKSIHGRNKIALVIMPEEAAVVQEIFTRYANGNGLTKILNWLNQSGIKGKRGAIFNSTNVRNMVRNPVYKGCIRSSLHDQHGKITSTAIYKGTHEPIISEELWNNAQVIRDIKRKCPSRAYERGHLLSGLIRCPDCNSTMTMAISASTRKDGSKKVYERYSCSQWKKHGSTVCHSNGIIAEKAEQIVFRHLHKIIKNPSIIKASIKQLKKQQLVDIKTLQKQLTTIDVEREKLETMQTKLQILFDPASNNPNWVNNKISEMNEKLNILSVEASNINAKIEACNTARTIPIDVIQIILERFMIKLQTADNNLKGILMKLLIKEIHFDKDKRIKSIILTFNDDVVKVLELAQSSLLIEPLTLEV